MANEAKAVIANELVRRQWGYFTLLELRFVALCISYIQIGDVGAPRLEFDLKKLTTFLNGRGCGDELRRFLKAVDLLSRKPLQFDEENGATKVFTHWFSVVRVETTINRVTIEFSRDTAQYLTNQKKHYTIYRLYYLCKALKSPGAMRLYQVLKSWESSGQVRMGLDRVRGLLNNGSRWCDLKYRALDPAVKMISNETDIDIRYTPKPDRGEPATIEFVITPQLGCPDPVPAFEKLWNDLAPVNFAEPEPTAYRPQHFAQVVNLLESLKKFAFDEHSVHWQWLTDKLIASCSIDHSRECLKVKLRSCSDEEQERVEQLLTTWKIKYGYDPYRTEWET